MIEQKILDAFETMWGPFPEPVMLIHKDRTILARNELARTAGIPEGIKCFSLNPEAASSACKHCKANLALREHRAVCTEETQNGSRIIGYWMPLKDDREVYVHFGVGVAESMGMKPSASAATAELVDLPH
jgi:hypothetical protein